MLKRTLRKAGTLAQAMPPAMPAAAMSGRSHACSPSPKASANQPAQSAPEMNIPSAPMFHTLARKPTASPRPMRTSGDALSSHSEIPLAELKGRMKKT